jgi:alpha-L-fucosidase
MIFQGKYATIRWVGNEDGFAPYPAWNSVGASDAASGTATAMHGDPQGTVWLPNEVDVSLRRPYWFWSRTNSDHVMSVSDLLSVYYKSIGRGANLLVNFSPSRDGLIDGPDVARAKEFGDLIRTRFGHPLKKVAGSVIRFSTATMVDHVLIQEDILKGERVRQFQVLGLSDDGKSEVIGSGTAIGVRRLIPVGHRLVRELRLQVDSSIGTPQIKNFAAFATGAEPPSDWNSPAGIYADDAVANWDQAGSFAIDLANKMGSSTNYRVRFVGQGGVSVRLLHPELVIDGVAQPALLRPEAGRADAFIVTLTALAKSIVLKGELAGAAKGTVLVKRQ